MKNYVKNKNHGKDCRLKFYFLLGLWMAGETGKGTEEI